MKTGLFIGLIFGLLCGFVIAGTHKDEIVLEYVDGGNCTIYADNLSITSLNIIDNGNQLKKITIGDRREKLAGLKYDVDIQFGDNGAFRYESTYPQGSDFYRMIFGVLDSKSKLRSVEITR